MNAKCSANAIDVANSRTAKRCQTVAGGRSEAKTSGIDVENRMHPEGMPDRAACAMGNSSTPLDVDTQTAYVLALSFGLLPDELVRAATERLAAKIEKNGFRMATGFLGTKPLLPVLSANGQNDLAIRLFQSRKFPSWGYEVEQGANTVWERWDSFTKEHGFNGAGGNQNASMNSFSHYSFGAVMQWAYQTLAGIDTDGPAYKRVIIHTHPPTSAATADVKPIDGVRSEYDSPRGKIVSAWKQTGDKFELSVTIPANTTARVILPKAANITERGHAISVARGVREFDSTGDRIEIEVGSGSYQFVCKNTR